MHERKQMFFRFMFLLTVFSFTNINAQNKVDTISKVNKYSQTGNYANAYILLLNFCENHKYKVDNYIIWQLAQLAFNVKDFAASESHYLKAIENEPNNNDLQIDFGKFLMNTNQYNKAISRLIPFQNKTYAKYYLAKTYYWQGNYRKAKSIINAFTVEEKDIEIIKSFIYEFALASAYILNISTQINSDDQPLKVLSPSIFVSKKINNWIQPIIEGTFLKFSGNDSFKNATTSQLSNIIEINSIKLKATMGIGMVSVNGNNELTANLQLNKKISNALSAGALVSRTPYFYTISSLNKIVMYNNKSIFVDINNFKGISGKLLFNKQHFEDKNNITNYSAWLLSPSLIKKVVTIKLGYGYQYNNADSNTYTFKMPVTTAGTNLEGIYNPYFTPKSQTIHSALLFLQIKPNNRFLTLASVNIPIKAKLQNPFLYAIDNNGVVSLYRGFAEQSFNPFEINIKMVYKFSNTVNATMNYNYKELYFYKGIYINFSLHILFK